MKGSEELRLTRPEGLVTEGRQESSPSLERQKVLSQEDQGPPETCIFWSARSGLKRARRTDHLIEAHPIPFRGMVLLRKCLESHHSSKLSDELPVKGSEELRLTRPEGQRLGGSGPPSPRATGSPPPSLERQKVLSQEDQGPPETCIF